MPENLLLFQCGKVAEWSIVGGLGHEVERSEAKDKTGVILTASISEPVFKVSHTL